ncbi:MAG: hypothetical protein GY786_09440, partial [Proteobacteria bacterium]|nr:hypothetical protein [Pseudomonadota bacterium]
MIRFNHRIAWVFGGFLVFLLLLTCLQRPWEKIETDILMFLNSGNLKQNQQIIAELDRFQSNRSSFLLCAGNFESVRKAALLSENALATSGLFTEVRGQLEAGSAAKLNNFYQKYLGIGQNPEVAKIMGTQDAGTQLFQRQQKLLMQFGSLSSQLEADPLLLRSDFPDLTHLKFGAFVPRQDWLTLQNDQEQCIFISAMNKESAFDAEYQDRFLNFYDQWQGQLYEQEPDIKLTALSLVRFAALSKQGIQEDLVKVTLGSLVGIVLFLAFIFRGTRPFWASQIPLLGGAICGISAVLMIYSKIHLIALALGATLTGVAIDYVFHYLAQWRFKTENWNSTAALREVLPGINLGLMTSLIGYAAFFLAPVKGIQQTAVIAIFGLVGAYLSLIIFFPVIFEKASKAPPDSRLINGTQISLNFWARYGLPVSLVVLLCVVGYLIFGLPKVNDDIRALNGMPPALKAEARHFAELSKMPDISRFLLVTHAEPEALLQLLENLSEDLDKLQQDHKIKGYMTSASLIPSHKQQSEVFQSTQKTFAEHRPHLEEQLISLGFEGSHVDQYFSQWEEPPATLNLREWLADPVSEPWRNMWVVKNNRFATAIYLGAGFDQEAVENLTREGVFFVDRTGEISRTFGEHRSATQGVLLLAYAFIFYILLIHLGLRDAFWITLPPFAGILNLLAVIKFFSLEINLFHLLSMILILGIGIDYSIFFYHSSKRQLSVTTIAVLASLVTTLLAFGVLGISTLPALQAFGLSLPIGLISAFLFGPLTQKSYRGFLPEMPKVIIWLGSLVRLLHITIFCGLAFVLFAGGGAVLAYLFFPLAKLFSRKTIRLRAIRQR